MFVFEFLVRSMKYRVLYDLIRIFFIFKECFNVWLVLVGIDCVWREYIFELNLLIEVYKIYR